MTKDPLVQFSDSKYSWTTKPLLFKKKRIKMANGLLHITSPQDAKLKQVLQRMASQTSELIHLNCGVVNTRKTIQSLIKRTLTHEKLWREPRKTQKENGLGN